TGGSATWPRPRRRPRCAHSNSRPEQAWASARRACAAARWKHSPEWTPLASPTPPTGGPWPRPSASATSPSFPPRPMAAGARKVRDTMTDKKFDLGGVVVATTLAFKEDPKAPAGLAVDYDRFAEHCDFLIRNGCRGVGPNGSLGEYSSLTDEERRKVIQVAVDTVGDRGVVVAGVHGVGWHQAVQWTEYAKEDGADGVLLLPPTIYRANRGEVIEHYTRVDEVGLPMMVYNNPLDTKVDLTPDIIAELSELENVVAVKEFSTDIRRVL